MAQAVKSLKIDADLGNNDVEEWLRSLMPSREPPLSFIAEDIVIPQPTRLEANIIAILSRPGNERFALWVHRVPEDSIVENMCADARVFFIEPGVSATAAGQPKTGVPFRIYSLREGSLENRTID